MPRALKGQQSFLRTAEEGMRLCRAVDDIGHVRAIAKKHARQGGYEYWSVSIGKSDGPRSRLCLSARMPRAEAEDISRQINSFLLGVQVMIAHNAEEMIRGSRLNLSMQSGTTIESNDEKALAATAPMVYREGHGGELIPIGAPEDVLADESK